MDAVVLETEKFKLLLDIAIFNITLMSNEGRFFRDFEFCGDPNEKF